MLWSRQLDTSPEAKLAPFLTAGASSLFLVSALSDLTATASADGQQRWTLPIRSDLPAVTADRTVGVVAGLKFLWRFVAVELQVLNQETGALGWRVPVPAGTTTLFEFQNQFGVVASDEMRTWTTSGTPGWTRALGGRVTTPVVFAKGLLFVGVDEPALIALDPGTGEIRWRTHLPTKPVSLAATDDRLYFGGADSALYSYDTMPRTKWAFRYPLVGTIGQPAVDSERVYFALKNNTVGAFGRKGGSQRWVHKLNSRPETGPILLGESLAIVLDIGEVVEVSTKDGTVRAPAKPPALPSVSVQSAVVSRDRARLFTVTTAKDRTRSLTAWGRQPAAAGRH